jgi:hypothetical protein
LAFPSIAAICPLTPGRQMQDQCRAIFWRQKLPLFLDVDRWGTLALEY